MLDKDNAIRTSVSEAIKKIPTDEKYYCKCSFMCFTLHSHSIQGAVRMHASSAAKKTTEDILNKIYIEKGTITGIWLVLSTVEVRKEFTGFQSGNKLADARTAQKGGG